ncbi:MAG: hypothetical protein WCH39_12330 [Schlesneria sp.]
MDTEKIAESVGEILLDRPTEPMEWTEELNQRRFALIDKEIQGTLTPAETFELADLTRIMRENVDSEANFPLEGVKALHRKLLELKNANSGV